MLYGGTDLHAPRSFAEMPTGEYTVCAEAKTDRAATAFRCRVVQHGGAAGTHFVIDFHPPPKPGRKVAPRTKPSVATPQADPQDKEAETLLALAEDQLTAGQHKKAIATAMRAYVLKRHPRCFLNSRSTKTGLPKQESPPLAPPLLLAVVLSKHL